MNIWKFLAQKLSSKIACLLIIVVESKGSSPGRQGFKMGIADDGSIYGSIGGGIMEHKMVEKAKMLLKTPAKDFFIQKQFHHKNTDKHQSGLICSGEQNLLFLPITDASIFHQIANTLESTQEFILNIRPNSIALFDKKLTQQTPFHYHFENERNWLYQEWIQYQDTIHIIGAGHVSLALSKQMSLLNFRVKVYDDREDLNTLVQNHFAAEKHIIDYQQIAQYIPSNSHDFVVIMSFGYRSDKLVLRALKDHRFRYIGMMGSTQKIKQLYQEYAQEGITSEQLKHVHTPIGLNIYSKTPQEIAVSIAAEIIQVKNQA